MATPEGKTPQHVGCVLCEHVWVAAWLPMDTTRFAALMSGLHCPACGAGAKSLQLRMPNDVPETDELSPALRDWLARGERGISSNTIVQHLTGIKTLDRFGGSHPHDGDDLRRCMLLLDAVPELQPRIRQMATCSKEWAALVADWDGLLAILRRELAREPGTYGKTYERMRELLAPIDGWSLAPSDGVFPEERRRRRTRRSA